MQWGGINMFRPNKRFKADYDKLFKDNPEQANVLLLLCELADEHGQVEISDDDLTHLFNARFNYSTEYSL